MKTTSEILRYSNQGTARRVRDEHATKIMIIILGDDGKFWLVTPAKAAELIAAGFEAIS